MALQEAFVTEHPWIDELDSSGAHVFGKSALEKSGLKTFKTRKKHAAYLKRENVGARVHAKELSARRKKKDRRLIEGNASFTLPKVEYSTRERGKTNASRQHYLSGKRTRTTTKKKFRIGRAEQRSKRDGFKSKTIGDFRRIADSSDRHIGRNDKLREEKKSTKRPENLLLSTNEHLAHTRTRQKRLLKPIERGRLPIPNKILFCDYFESVGSTVVDSLGWSVTKDVVKQICKSIRNVHVLRIRDSEAFDEECMQLLSECRDIREFVIEYCPNVTNDAIDIFRRSHAHLTYMNITGCESIDDKGFGQIMTTFRRLKRLKIVGSPRLTDLGMKAMGERSRQYDAIETLVLEDCPLVTDKGLLALFRGLWGLRYLRVSLMPRISDLGFMGLVSALGTSACPHLTEIAVVEMPNVTSAGVAWIASGCPSLRSLNLSECPEIGDPALRSVGEHCAELTSLILRNCSKITSDGIVEIGNCARLESVDLTGCVQVSARGVVHLAERCKQLAVWNLVGVNQLTDAAIRNMRCASEVTREIRFTTGSTAGVGRAAFFGAPRISDAGMLPFASNAASLRVLHLSGFTRLTDVTVRAVARQCSMLEELHISGCVGVSDKSLVPLVRRCAMLRSLHANECGGLTDATLLALAESVSSSASLSIARLKSLHVGHCKHITNKGIVAMSGVCADLEVVNVKFCNKLTVEGVVVLAGRCPKLRSFNLAGVECVTSDIIYFVARRCPLLRNLNVRNTAISRANLRRCESRLFFATVHDQGVQFVARNHQKALRMRYTFVARKRGEVVAARTIQKQFRAHLAHKASVAYFLAQARKQKEKEDKIAAEKAAQLRRMNAAATGISKLYRGWIQRRRYRQMRERKLKVVLRIQRCWRGVLGRLRAVARREELMAERAAALEEKIDASVQIQRCWRGYSARVNFRMLKGFLVFQERLCTSAATLIQSLWRCNRARKVRRERTVFRDVRNRAEAHSATLLANCWRGFVARDITQKLRDERNTLRGSAATTIQSCLRRHQCQMKYVVIRERAFWAATTMQRNWRMRASRKVVEALRQSRREYERELEKMAKRVQRAWRCRLSRLIVAAARYKMWESRRKKYGAIKIQTTYRRYAAQRLRKAKKKLRWQKRREAARRTRQDQFRVAIVETGAAKKIQSWYRCFIERRYLKVQIRWRRKEAAINIQRVTRGRMSRHHTEEYRERVVRSTILIQNLWRVRKARLRFFEIVHTKHLEQEQRRKQLKMELIETMRKKQERLNRQLAESDAARLIQFAAREWLERREMKRLDAELERKKQKRLLEKSQQKKGFFQRWFGPKDEDNAKDGASESPKMKGGKRRGVFNIRIRPRRMLNAMKANALALVSKSARMKMNRDKLDRLAYSVFSSQKHLFNLDGIVEVKFTVGEEERESFQQVQDKLRAQKQSYFEMLNGDFSTRPPKQPLRAHIWAKKEPGATNLITSVEIIPKPITKTVREFKALVKSWESQGIAPVMHHQIPFILHIRRGGKDPIVDMKISTRRLDEENLSLAGYTKVKSELQHWLYGEDKPPQKPFYLWLNIMNIQRSKEQKRVGGLMKRQPWYNERLQHMMDYLSLTEDEVLGLYDLFKEVDADGGGTVDIDELFHYLEEPKSAISQGFFEWIDMNDDGELDFSEYVHMLGTVCMLGKRDMFKIAFAIVDRDKSGYVDKKELMKMVQMLEPSPRVRVALLHKIDELTKKHGDNFIKMTEFKKIVDQFPSLLYPIQRLQDKLMDASMGTRWWDRKRTDFAKARQYLKEQQELINRTLGD